DVFLCVRAEDVLLVQGEVGQTSARNRLPGTVRSVGTDGPLVRVELDCGFPLVAVVTRPAAPALGLRAGSDGVARVKAPAVRLGPRRPEDVPRAGKGLQR